MPSNMPGMPCSIHLAAIHRSSSHTLMKHLLSFIFLPYFASLRRLAANVRGILLRAVRGRVEASRLAAELDAALETMQHGICMLDEQGVIAVTNDRAELVFSRFVPGNWGGRPFSAMMSAAAERGTIPARSAQQLQETVEDGTGGKVLLRLDEGQLLTLAGVDIERDDFVVLRQQHAIRQTNITGASDGNFHCSPPFAKFISAFKASIWA